MNKDKEYSNILATMIDYHNREAVPFLKYLNGGRSSRIKIKGKRRLLVKDALEEGKYDYDLNALHEYLLLNKFIIDILGDEVKALIDIVNNHYEKRDTSNLIISAHTLYNLIEDKKKEIIEKLKK